MAEDVARAVGSNGPTTVEIGGKQCTTRPLFLKELGEVERACLKQYQRHVLETFSQNLDLMPTTDAAKEQMMREKFEEVSKWDVRDLPMQWVYDPGRVVLTEALEKWCMANFEGLLEMPNQADMKDPKKRKSFFQNLVATGLESRLLSDEEYKEMSGGKELSRTKTGYVNWWVTGSFNGMLELVFTAFSHNEGITRNQVSDAVARNKALLVQLSREIANLTAPEAGNT